MAQASFSSRLPVIAIGAASVLLASYLLFFRGGSPTPAAPETKPEPQIPVAETEPAPAAGTGSMAATLLPPAPRPEAPVAAPKPAQDGSIKSLMEAGKFYDARKAVADLFLSTTDDAVRAELADRAMALNKRLLMTNPDDRDIEMIAIATGENPTSFARRIRGLHGEPGLLFMLNGMKPGTTIRAGQRLRTPKGEFSIFVDKTLFKLWICYEGAPFRAYPVCVGADDKTPATKWVVGQKNPKPAWTAPPDWLEQEKMKNPIAYGNPKNPLGDYWIGIDSDGYPGFGIHGTNQPETMGQKKSMGCVRMINTDVVELAGCVWKDMKVVTVE